MNSHFSSVVFCHVEIIIRGFITKWKTTCTIGAFSFFTVSSLFESSE